MNELCDTNGGVAHEMGHIVRLTAIFIVVHVCSTVGLL